MAGINAVRADLVGLHVDEGAEVLMGTRAVIALQKIVDYILPVRLDLVAQPMAERQLLYIGRPMVNLIPQGSRESPQRRRRRVQVYENEATEFLNLNRGEANLAGCEILEIAGEWCPGELAVQPIAPSVVRTDDPLNLAFAGQHGMGAVFADIVERAQDSLRIANDDDGISRNFRRRIAAWRTHLLGVTDPLPGLCDDFPPVEGEPNRVRIGFGTQRQRT